MAEEESTVVPLTEERVTVAKHTLEKDRVHLSVVTHEQPTQVAEQLFMETINVERVPRNEFVESMPPVRHEADVTVYPVVEEVLIKKLLLREEVRVTRRRDVQPHLETLMLKRQTATIERIAAPDTPT